jgi:hypothetical protein
MVSSQISSDNRGSSWKVLTGINTHDYKLYCASRFHLGSFDTHPGFQKDQAFTVVTHGTQQASAQGLLSRESPGVNLVVRAVLLEEVGWGL